MNIGAYSKCIVAAIMALIYFINTYLGINLPVDQTTINSIVVAAIPVLVYQIANKEPAAPPVDSGKSGV